MWLLAPRSHPTLRWSFPLQGSQPHRGSAAIQNLKSTMTSIPVGIVTDNSSSKQRCALPRIDRSFTQGCESGSKFNRRSFVRMLFRPRSDDDAHAMMVLIPVKYEGQFLMSFSYVGSVKTPLVTDASHVLGGGSDTGKP